MNDLGMSCSATSAFKLGGSMRNLGAAQALFLATGGVAVLALMDALVKSLSGGLPTIEILFFRQIGAAVLLGILVLVTGASLPHPSRLKTHVLRSLMIGMTAFAFFYALGELPLSLVTAISLTAPIMVAVLGVVILKEELNKTLVVASLLGFAGAMIVTFGGNQTPISEGGSVLAWAAAIISPITYAISIIILKNQTSQSSAQVITFVQAGLIAMFCLPFLMGNFVVPVGDQIWQVAALGLLGAVGFMLFVTALKHVPASMFAMVDNTALIWAALYGFLFFTEVPHPTLWVGAAMIVCACLLVARRHVRKSPKR
ncbi:DMT family transporter [uncultured Maritalea sp.]|uniref:DMT family transporter n=1 Tax=uncultured Maritalea sp. TaxID=757249 RepID=UPI00261E5B5B|nr:DMT family transporter [uncultured Maritalea sp.]